MKRTSRRTLALVVFVFMAQTLLGCNYVAATLLASTPPTAGAPEGIEAPRPDYSDAQATIDAGNSQLSDLSRQGSAVDLAMSQTEEASVKSNQDANQLKKDELELQATVISLNMAHAAATQEFINQQTQIAVDATIHTQNSTDEAAQAADLIQVAQTAQAQRFQDALALQTVQAGATQAAFPLTATYSAHLQNATETVQAQALLYAQATQVSQAQMTRTAYPLTATPLAITQAALLMQQYGREQQSFTDQVVAPLIPILVIMILILLTLGILWVYRWFIPVTWSRRLHPAHVNYHLSPMTVIDGVIVNPAPPPEPKTPLELKPANPAALSARDQIHVEIVDAADKPVADWIAEVEFRMNQEVKRSL